jgi:hypothetical protein
MSVDGIHAITSKFKERWLSPLQFPGAHRSVEQRLDDLENAKQGQQPANSRIKIRVKGQKSQAPAPQASPAAREEIKRVGEDHVSDSYGWHAQHSTAGTDLLHTFNQRMDAIQAQKKPSESGGWAAYNDTFGAGAKSTASPSPAPGGQAEWRDHGQGHQIRTYPTYNPDGSRGARKIGIRPKPGGASPAEVSPVQSPQQFSQGNFAPAAKAAPRPARTNSTPVVQAAPQPSAGGVGKGVQRGLFPPGESGPKVKAVRQREDKPVQPGPGKGQMSFDDVTPKPSAARKKAAPKAPSASEWHSMLTDSVNERKKSKKPPAPGQGSLF